MLLKIISAAMFALVLCAGVRADDGCKTCEEHKAHCSECDSCSTCSKVKHCSRPVKNFFVHDVGGTIGKGFGIHGCDTCKTCETPVEVQSDCGCNK